MEPSELSLPLASFPLPGGDLVDILLDEAEQNLGMAGHLPWMVLAGTERERLAVSHPSLEPGQCALAEEALLRRSEVEWTLLVGEAALPSGMGVLRQVFLRWRFRDGRWQVYRRPFVHHEELLWLEEWVREEGEGFAPEALAPLFPEPAEGSVRFVGDQEEELEPSAVIDIPEGSSPTDIARLGGLLIESWFVKRGFVPPTVVAVRGDQLQVYFLPKSGPAHAAPDLAVRQAQDPAVQAVGLFSRVQDTTLQPPAEQIRLSLEFRDGPALIWRRRFRIVSANRARWLDAVGEVMANPQRARNWFP